MDSLRSRSLEWLPLEAARLELVRVGIVAGLMAWEDEGGEGLSSERKVEVEFICSTKRLERPSARDNESERVLFAAGGVVKGGLSRSATEGKRLYFLVGVVLLGMSVLEALGVVL